MYILNHAAFPASPAARIQEMLRGISQALSQPLEPIEYCQRWVVHPLHERGYKQACDRALAEACGIWPTEVHLWGRNYSKRPEYIPYLLRLADTVRLAQSLGVCASKLKVPTPEIISLSGNAPQPRFRFWQQVVNTQDQDEHGTIVGMEYNSGVPEIKAGWWYAIELDDNSPSKVINPVAHVHEQNLGAIVYSTGSHAVLVPKA